ncbi:MAG: hypothetical protein AABZ55_05750 [Bdellovibrionota bacterium]
MLRGRSNKTLGIIFSIFSSILAVHLAGCGDVLGSAYQFSPAAQPDSSKTINQPPVVTTQISNLDPGSRRVIVPPSKNNLPSTDSSLGRGYGRPFPESSENSELGPCVKGRIHHRNTQYRTRYRIELKDLGIRAKLVVSATVVHREIELKIPQLTETAKGWKKTKKMLRRNCGSNYISKVEYGGRLEKSFQFNKDQFEGTLPLAMGTAVEVADSTMDIAYFKSSLNKLNQGLRGDMKSYDEVVLKDSRSGSEVTHMVSDFSTDPDLFVKYAEGYKGSNNYLREQQQYIWIDKLPTW